MKMSMHRAVCLSFALSCVKLYYVEARVYGNSNMHAIHIVISLDMLTNEYERLALCVALLPTSTSSYPQSWITIRSLNPSNRPPPLSWSITKTHPTNISKSNCKAQASLSFPAIRNLYVCLCFCLLCPQPHHKKASQLKALSLQTHPTFLPFKPSKKQPSKKKEKNSQLI